LERGRTIGETKEHDKWFKQPSVSSESRFPLIAFLHSDIVKTSANIQFCEILGSSEFGYQLWDKWQRIFVFHSHGIEHAVVLNQAESTILLLDEEDR